MDALKRLTAKSVLLCAFILFLAASLAPVLVEKALGQTIPYQNYVILDAPSQDAAADGLDLETYTRALLSI